MRHVQTLAALVTLLSPSWVLAQATPPAPPPSPEDATAQPQPQPQPQAVDTTAPAPSPESAAPPASAEAAPLEEPPVTSGAASAEAKATVDPAADASRLAAQGLEEPSPIAGELDEDTKEPTAGTQQQTFAEDWWTHARPLLELHGGLRGRGEMFHNFSLGRRNTPGESLWAPPPDQRYSAGNQQTFGPALCAGSETDAGSGSSDLASDGLYSCDNKTQAGANMRFRLNPSIHISDNVHIHGQVDLLDNLVLGSTPDGYRYAYAPEGLTTLQRSGYNQFSFYDSTTVPPDSGTNGFSDSIRVKRAWGEYNTPLGDVLFGRMPHHFGLGMLYNSGDTFDADYQSTVDRLQLATSFASWDLRIALMADFVSEGATDAIGIPGSQPYDRAQLDDINQYGLLLLKQGDPELERLALARENVIFNAGFYLLYRSQTLAADQALSAADGGPVPGANLDNQPGTYARRDAYAFTPDLWLQLKYKGFSAELEAAGVIGKIGSPSIGPNSLAHFQNGDPSLKLRQFGAALELGQRLVEDRLKLGFDAGFATGDADTVDPSLPGELVPGPAEAQRSDDTISTFRFNPAYRVDLILNRNLLQRVQGTYYFRPNVSYDFLRDSRGQRAGGSFAGIWTRAAKSVQTPGHDADLGLELNGSLYYQARDGSLNDDLDTMGGFYTMLQYGVLFPLAGLGYAAEERVSITGNTDLSVAQVLRLHLGILF